MPMLNWMGREKAARATKDVVMKILREEKSLGYRVGGSRSCATGTAADARERVPPVVADAADARERVPPEGILVHGDNLEALKALLPFYAGEVKCIYIDPPYNTGSAFEHYDDNLEHSTWLNMMYPRLKLLREFLREDGSIWISIDDREGAYLRVICDEIFGRQNFVSNISWQRTYSTRNDAKGIVNEIEHILVYSKREGWQPKKLARTEEMNERYKNIDNDPKGLWRPDNAYAPGAKTHQGMVYAIQHPFTGALLYPTSGRCWTFEQADILEIMNGWCPYELREIDDAEKRAAICGVGIDEVRKGVKAIVLSKALEESKKSAEAVLKRGQWPRFYFSKNGKGGIARKTYLSAVGDVPPTNLFEYKDVGHTDEAKKEVLKVFDGQSPFATPKPERLIKRVLEIATDEGDLVMDSFLGSGTTAAVAHKMGRRWIGIEMGEHAKTHCAVRMKKVVDGEQGGISKAVKWSGGGGFRFYELGEPLLDERGQIAESIPYEVLAAHIWWQDTGTAWGTSKGTVLGIHEGVAYALLYNGILHDRSVNGGNVLTRQTLGVIKKDLADAQERVPPKGAAGDLADAQERVPPKGAAGGSRSCATEYRKLVVYGEWNKLGEERLEDEKIEFRQTPYDVVTRR